MKVIQKVLLRLFYKLRCAHRKPADRVVVGSFRNYTKGVVFVAGALHFQRGSLDFLCRLDLLDLAQEEVFGFTFSDVFWKDPSSCVR